MPAFRRLDDEFPTMPACPPRTSLLGRIVHLDRDGVEIAEVHCAGGCRGKGPEGYSPHAQIVLPYRGVYVEHVGGEDAVADANQALLVTAGESYRVSHPVAGGDDSLLLTLPQDILAELSPRALRAGDSTLRFRRRTLPLDARTQLRLAEFLRRLAKPSREPLAIESGAVELARAVLAREPPLRTRSLRSTRALVDRAKLLLESDPGRRWSLRELGAALNASPVYLTQLFRRLEGVPLYRYQLRLRLARALAELPHAGDLTTLALDLGFASLSQFSSHFRANFGLSPNRWRERASSRTTRAVATQM